MQNPIRYKDLYIPKPCHEEWETMDATEKGRFCQSCKKEVIDFRLKTERELNALIASGTWSGCGRFPERRLGMAPEVQPSVDLESRVLLDRWRKGAAAAILLLGLWPLPVTAASSGKHIVCLVPSLTPDQDSVVPHGPNYFVSAVLLSDHGEQLPLDFWINLHLPSGELIRILTHHGFFGIDLEGKAVETDTILVTIPAMEMEDSEYEMKIEASSFRFRLQEGQNLTQEIDAVFFNKTWSFCSGSARRVPLGNLPSSMDLISTNSSQPEMEPEMEPLFKSRSAEEKAAKRLARDQQKQQQLRP